MPAIGFHHKHIADVSVGREVRHYTRKAYVLAIRIQAKAKRILDRAGHNLARNSLCPTTLTQETVDNIEINPFFIRADDDTFAMLCDLFLEGFHSDAILT